MKTPWSVILALLMLAIEAALAALITIGPVKLLRARSGEEGPHPQGLAAGSPHPRLTAAVTGADRPPPRFAG